MNRKIIMTLLLILSIVFSLNLYCFAEESELGITINPSSPISYTGYINDGNPSKGMAANSRAVYSFNAEKSGMYNLIIRAIVFGNGTVKVDLGNLEVVSTSVNDTGGKTIEFVLGEIGIREGGHLFALKFSGSESVYLSGIRLERTGEYVTRKNYIINGHDCDDASEGVTGGDPESGMNVNSWAEYEIEIDEGGVYLVSAECAANEGKIPQLVLYQDDVKIAELSVNGAGWNTIVKTSSAETVFEAGKVTIKAVLKGSNAEDIMRIKSIIISEKILTPEERFVKEINEASTIEEIESIILKEGSRFLVSFAEMQQEVFYKKIIYENMLKLSYKNLEDVNKCFTKFVNIETREPVVTVVQENKVVTDIGNGEILVRVGARFNQELTAVAALYKDDVLIDATVGKTGIYIPETLPALNGVSGSELRIFFFDGLESISPAILPANEEVIFVAETGSDSAEGSYDFPVKSVKEATKRATELDNIIPCNVVINFKSGEYPITESINIGNSTKGITYRSLDKDAPATISGGIHISGWEKDESGIYSVAVPNLTDVRQLYINGYPAQRARGEYVYYAVGRWDNPNTGYEEDGFIVECEDFPRLLKPRDAEIAYNIMWTIQRMPIEDIAKEDENQFVVKMDQPYYSEAITMYCGGGVQPTVGQQFYVENDLTLLDSPGEFYFNKDDKILYYYPYENENMKTCDAVVPVTDKMLCIAGNSKTDKVKNVTFENLSFKYGAYTEVNEKGTCVFQAECMTETSKEGFLNQNPVSDGRSLMAHIDISNAHNIRFKDCEMSCMGATAFRYGNAVSDSVIEGCIIKDIGGSAISIGEWKTKNIDADYMTENILVENNVITRSGIDLMSNPAISAYYGKNFTIGSNTIFDIPYSGISLGWGWESKTPKNLGCSGHIIEKNEIYDISKVVRDGGHIYLLGAMSDVYVRENYIYSSEDRGGIYFDTGSSGTIVSANVVKDSINWLFGGYQSEYITVLKNYVDKPDEKFSTPENSNCLYTEPTVYENGNWSGQALEVANSAGVTDEYQENVQKVLQPEWRYDLHFNVPRNEAVSKDDFLVEAEDYTDYYVAADDKEEPSVYIQGIRYVVGDIRMNDWFEYTVDVPTDGKYTVEIRYTTGTDAVNTTPRIKLYVNKSDMNLYDIYKILPCTKTDWSAYVPYTVGEISLKAGTNKVKLKSTSYGFSMDALKFIKCE